jgi:iron(III) transport system ATP-binding protein
MKDGQIVQSGSPVEVYRRPINEYVAGLLGPYNLLSASEVKYFLPELEINEQFNKALLRPEQIIITENQKNALKAVVQNQNFYGHYSELEVKIWGRILKVKTEQKSYQRADTVFITLSKDDIWFI